MISFRGKFFFFSVIDVAVKGGFEGIDLDLAEVVTEEDSGGFLFVLFGGESTVHELDSFVESGANVGEDSDKLRILRVRIPVKEAIHSTIHNEVLFAVAMQVEDEPDISGFADFG